MRQVDLPEQCSQGGDFGLWHSRGGSVVNMVVGPAFILRGHMVRGVQY